jgi:hypothetical protein
VDLPDAAAAFLGTRGSRAGLAGDLVTLLLILAGLAVAGFLVDRLLLWLEWRGLIDYRTTYPGRINTGAVGPAFLAIQGLLEPEKRHAAEEQRALRTESDEMGGPGDPGREKSEAGVSSPD